MKANELMIGDWVEPRQSMIPTVYCKVEGIYPDGTVHLDKAEMLFTLDELTPVPLTPEILEKNGFEKGYSSILTADGYKKLPVYKYKNIKQAQSIRHNLIKVCVSLDESKYDVEFGIDSHIFDLEYVHEFQHALRLCGITLNIEI